MGRICRQTAFCGLLQFRFKLLLSTLQQINQFNKISRPEAFRGQHIRPALPQSQFSFHPAGTIDLSGLKLFESKSLMEPLLNFLPLSRDREGELAVFISFDGGRAVIIQLIEIFAELEF